MSSKKEHYFYALCTYFPKCNKGKKCRYVHPEGVCLAFLKSKCTEKNCALRHFKTKPCEAWLENQSDRCICPFDHSLCQRFVLTRSCPIAGCTRKHEDISIFPETSTSSAEEETKSVKKDGDSVESKPSKDVEKEDCIIPMYENSWDSREKEVYDWLRMFALSKDKTWTSPKGLSSRDRAIIHQMSDRFKFEHQSVGKGKGKVVLVRRLSTKEFNAVTQVAITIPPAEPTFDSQEQEIYQILQAFALGEQSEYHFASEKSNLYRKKVHQLAPAFEFEHQSIGARGSANRHVVVRKVDPALLAMRKEASQMLLDAMEEYKKEQDYLKKLKSSRKSSHAKAEKADDNSEDDDDAIASSAFPITPSRTPDICFRYLNWNIEWMDFFFESDIEFRKDNAGNDISDVNKLCANIACAIRLLNADIVAVLEGPSSVARMQLFQQQFLGDEYQIYFLIKKVGPIKDAHLHIASDEFLRREWRIDTRGDLKLQEYGFTRRPLVIKAHITIGSKKKTRALYAIAMHTKSKFIGGGKRLWQSTDPAKKFEFIRKAVQNRRRIAAECTRTRQCIDQVIYAEHHNPLVVLSGDLNDGPGPDFFESIYLLFNSVDLVLGSPFYHSKLLHALLIRSTYVPPEYQWSCIFDDYVDEVPGKKVLLDHVCVTNELRKYVKNAGIAHDIFVDCCTKGIPWEKASRQDRPSDHRPVFVDFALKKT